MLVERMRGFGTTIFAEMSALALTTGAINLGQGFPDTDGPMAMLEKAAHGLRHGLNQYPPGPGVPELRTAIAAHQLRCYDLTYDADSEVLVTVGATEAVSATILALCEPQSDVVVFEPYYDSYAAAIALAGARRVPVALRPTSAGGRFSFDPDEFRAAITPATRVVLINSPHNPTGTVLTRTELDVIAAACIEHDLIAVTDDVYEHLVYDGGAHIPLATLPGMQERTVSISSAGKSFSVTGWKIGWICAPAELVRAVNTVKQFLTYTHSAPMQLAVAYALEHEMPWVEELRVSLQGRRDRLAAGLETVGLTVSRTQGTYFIQADVRVSASTTGRRSPGRCRTTPASSRSRPRSSVTPRASARRSYASRSASGMTFSTKRSRGLLNPELPVDRRGRPGRIGQPAERRCPARRRDRPAGRRVEPHPELVPRPHRRRHLVHPTRQGAYDDDRQDRRHDVRAVRDRVEPVMGLQRARRVGVDRARDGEKDELEDPGAPPHVDDGRCVMCRVVQRRRGTPRVVDNLLRPDQVEERDEPASDRPAAGVGRNSRAQVVQVAHNPMQPRDEQRTGEQEQDHVGDAARPDLMIRVVCRRQGDRGGIGVVEAADQ